jgi:hypothetical protein
VPCSTSIPITVDNESCVPVTYYGYIQACCETLGSPNGRIPWQVTFVPNPTCIGVEFDCNNLTIAGVTITNPGQGYNPGLPPNALISGGGGAGGLATVIIGNGGIASDTLTNAGAGLTDGFYPLTPAGTVTGVGVGATYDVTVAGGIIISATRVGFGTGYAPFDTINFPAIPGSATELVTVNSVNTSQIQQIIITNPGSGYSSTPIITIDPAPGFGGFAPVTGTALLVLAVCPAFNLGTNCDAIPIGNSGPTTFGQDFVICYPGGLAGAPVPPVEYGAVENPGVCCFDCHSVQISQPPAQDANVFYQDCATGLMVAVFVPKNTFIIVCARNESFASDVSDTIFTVGMVCP